MLDLIGSQKVVEIVISYYRKKIPRSFDRGDLDLPCIRFGKAPSRSLGGKSHCSDAQPPDGLHLIAALKGLPRLLQVSHTSLTNGISANWNLQC